MAKCRRKTGYYSVDEMMRNTALSLIRDFRANLSDPGFSEGFQNALRSEPMSRVRELVPVPNDEMSAAEYKATYQIASVFKRYRFENDTYSDQELIEKAVTGFFDTQSRLAAQDLDSLPAESQRVLDLAADYIARVLGVYSDEEHRNLSRFGRRATVGIPARNACEAARWELPISGSQGQIDWFDSEMSQDEMVQDYWASQKESDREQNNDSRSTYQPTSSLKLTLVPKTFKSFRAIMPNTTIGSYMSYGLGEMMRKRLRREGYDIRTLQMRHRNMACLASVHGMHTTADLSSASDSISIALVKRLFPADWTAILLQSRIGQVVLPGNLSVESLTFCTMGIGYTFPLQTLVFLALLKAIEQIMFHRSFRQTISVYGDDMIYSSRMHPGVVKYFQQFGFVLNVEKTFSEGHFRESCGGDYYHGVDVRPFQPQNGSASVSPKAYEAILYKYVNGLLARWFEYEIGRTLAYLTSELEGVTGKCKIIPGSYPDDAGIKCPSLGYWYFLQSVKCARPKSLGHGVYRFSFLRLVSDRRKELRHVPYLRARLRGSALPGDFESHQWQGFQELPSPLALFIEEQVGVTGDDQPLITEEDRPIITFRSKISGRRLRRSSTYVTVGHTGRYASVRYLMF